MTVVVSFGSVNLDRTWTLDAGTLDILGAQDRFPAPGETKTIEETPVLSGFGGPAVSLGGKGANDAVAAARLGADAAMVGAVGRAASDPGVLDTLGERSVDTTGAGDTFTGTLATRLGEGAGERPAVGFAAAASTRATESVGAQTAMPPVRRDLDG